MAIIEVETKRGVIEVEVPTGNDEDYAKVARALTAQGLALEPERGGFLSGLVPSGIDDFRPAVIAAGGLAGTAIGAGVGAAAGGVGALPGGAAGGLLGSAAASSLYDLLVDMGRASGLIEGGSPKGLSDLVTGPTPAPLGQSQFGGGMRVGTQRALNEGALDVGFSGAGAALRPLAKAGAQKLLVGGQEALSKARGLVSMADEAGVGLGIEDVTSRALIKGYRTVVGKFPIIGAAFRTADERKSGELATAFARQADRVGPSVTLAESGVDMARAARSRYQSVKAAVSSLYENSNKTGALDIARSVRARVPLENFKRVAAEVATESSSKRPLFTTVKIVDGEPTEVLSKLPKAVKSKLDSFAPKWSRVEDTVDVDQYQSVLKDVTELMDQSQKLGLPFKRLFELKKALELDLRQISDPQVAQMLKKADGAYEALARLTERPVGKSFSRVDKNIFGAGPERPGSLNEDELFKAVFNNKSSRSMADLRRLVGRRPFNRALRTHIDEVAMQALDRAKSGDILFDVGRFRKALGLHNPKSPEFAAMSQALKSTNVTPAQLNRFLKVLETASEQGVIDVSQFVARRAVLGGPMSAVRSFMPGQTLAAGAFTGKTAGVMGGVGVLLALRKMSNVITDPEMLKTVLKSIDPNASQVVKDAAVARFVRLVDERIGPIQAGSRAVGRLNKQAFRAIVEQEEPAQEVR